MPSQDASCSLYIPAAFSGYIVGDVASRFDWQTAGIWVIALVAAVGAACALMPRPKAMAL
jgi:hypothetical protein